ncbi:MAG: hypothetical protein GPJ54_04655, partial [Candidatus Heimdallarchaeota archaeon]|nr:hypothetical protein [Candidatus Heimdallarchaeota archaeon]
MKNLHRSTFSKTFVSLILIFVLSMFSILYFLDDGFPDQQIEHNTYGTISSLFDFPMKFSLQQSDNYSQYGQFSMQIGKLVVFYDSSAKYKTPEFPTTIGNDSGIIEKFQIESHIVISKDNKIIEIL